VDISIVIEMSGSYAPGVPKRRSSDRHGLGAKKPRSGWIVLRHPFSKLSAAQTFIEAGDQGLLVAIAWAVLSSSDGSELGFVLAAWTGPRAVFLVFGGVLVDRWNRSLVGVGASGGLAAAVAFMAATWSMGITSPVLWLIAAPVLGLLDGIRLPLGYALIPLVVSEGELVEANRWSQFRLWATLALGPPLGGALVAMLGVGGALGVIAASYALGGLYLLGLPSMMVQPTEPSSVIRDFRGGLSFVLRHTRLPRDARSASRGPDSLEGGSSH
jgi:MFS family permease